VRVSLAGAVLLLAASGCGVLHGGPGKPQEVSREQLAIMVVPQSGLGKSYAKLELDTDSGPESADEFADSSIDPDDTVDSVRKAGWRAGYSLGYYDSKVLGKKKHRGLLGAGTEVHLFESASAARADIVKTVQDYARFRGETIDGIKVGDSESFSVEVGDEAWGLEGTITAGAFRFRQTTVAFRSGPVEGVASIVRTDGEGEQLEAIRLARVLAERVERSLAGELHERPVDLAGKHDVPRKRLEAMTLSSRDLPRGARMTTDRLDRTDDDYDELIRAYEPEGLRLGGSRVISVRAVTQVYHDSQSVKIFKRLFAGKKGRQFLQDAFLSGFKGGDSKPKRVASRSIDLGRRPLSALRVSFSLEAGGRFDLYLAVVIRGKAQASIGVLGPVGALDARDIEPLVERAWEKLG
jgi:hypothetical protein